MCQLVAVALLPCFMHVFVYVGMLVVAREVPLLGSIVAFWGVILYRFLRVMYSFWGYCTFFWGVLPLFWGVMRPGEGVQVGLLPFSLSFLCILVVAHTLASFGGCCTSVGGILYRFLGVLYLFWGALNLFGGILYLFWGYCTCGGYCTSSWEVLYLFLRVVYLLFGVYCC